MNAHFTKEWYADYMRKQRAKANRDDTGAGLRPAVKERNEGMSLERVNAGKEPRSVPPSGRTKITFRIFSVRPSDYDNYWIKCLQDCLVKAGILDGDDWNLLQGTVISEKADRQEERTEVTIERL